MASTRAIGIVNRNLGRTVERISSGLRIVRARDDAAGLGVATNLSTQARSIRVSMRNTNDGISIVQTSEGALSTTQDMLQRMRELAVQSASETLGTDERAYLDTEFFNLLDEIKKMTLRTEFNGILIGGIGTTQLSVQVGIQNSSNSRITIDLADLKTIFVGVRTERVNTATNAQAALDAIDLTLDSSNSMRSRLGAVQNRLESALNSSAIKMEALESASSRIMDADYAYETAEMAKQQIIQQAAVAALSHAKNMSRAVISLLE